MLGGHDHVIMEKVVNGVPVIKSGTNFNNIGIIHLYPKSHQTEQPGVNYNFEWEILKILNADKVDPVLEKYVDELMDEYSKYD